MAGIQPKRDKEKVTAYIHQWAVFRNCYSLRHHEPEQILIALPLITSRAVFVFSRTGIGSSRICVILT